jgi:hypothetical protein
MQTTTKPAYQATPAMATAARVFAEGGSGLPVLREEILPYAEVPGEEKQVIDGLMEKIDLRDSNSIIFFGSSAQQQVTEVADQMLDGVRNKDLGGPGNILGEMVATLRGFDFEALDPGKKPSFWSRLFGRAKPLVKILQRYEEVRKQVDAITDKLETHKTTLLTDITTLDRLYAVTLDYFHQLEMYITAGEEKLRQLDMTVIPERAAKVDAAGGVLEAQELRDLRASRDDLDRRGARSAAHPAGGDAEPAFDPPGPGKRQGAGQQDQLNPGQYRAAVAPATRHRGGNLPFWRCGENH